MSGTVQDLLHAFDRLSEPERQEFACELLRKTLQQDLPPLDDESLDRLADEAFSDLDVREASDEHP